MTETFSERVATISGHTALETKSNPPTAPPPAPPLPATTSDRMVQYWEMNLRTSAYTPAKPRVLSAFAEMTLLLLLLLSILLLLMLLLLLTRWQSEDRK